MGTQSNYALRLPVWLKSGAEQTSHQFCSVLVDSPSTQLSNRYRAVAAR